MMTSTRYLSFAQICIVLTLAFTILNPFVYNRLDVEITSLVINDLSEQDSQKQGEIENATKVIFIHDLEYLVPFVQNQSYALFDAYLENDLCLYTKIVLPPPRCHV